MKKIIVILLIICFNTSFAQTVLDYDMVKIEKPADCKAAEPMVKEAASYLLSTPFEKNNTNRTKSLSFILKWAGKTPDHAFSFEDDASKVMQSSGDIMGLYIAAMTKYSLENKEAAKDKKLVKLNAITNVLNYCEDKKNNLKMTKQLKKLAEAKAEGELEQML